MTDTEGFTLRWVDGRPFDPVAESRHYTLGIKRKVRNIYPSLAARLQPDERVDAHGSGLMGQNVRCFWIASDQALHIFATPLYRYTIIEHICVPYGQITQCRLKIRRFPLLVIRLGVLRVRTTKTRGANQQGIPGKQADALKAALERRLPEGVVLNSN